MKIKSSTFCVEDNYGLRMELKPLKDETTNEQATKDIHSFFSEYRLLTAYKIKNAIDKKKDEMSSKTIHDEIETTKSPPLANPLRLIERIYIIKKKLPSIFGMEDFIKYVVDNFNYSRDDAKAMWKSTIANLTKNSKVEITDRTTSKNKYTYRYISTDTIEENTDNRLRLLKEGEKITL